MVVVVVVVVVEVVVVVVIKYFPNVKSIHTIVCSEPLIALT